MAEEELSSVGGEPPTMASQLAGQEESSVGGDLLALFSAPTNVTPASVTPAIEQLQSDEGGPSDDSSASDPEEPGPSRRRKRKSRKRKSGKSSYLRFKSSADFIPQNIANPKEGQICSWDKAWPETATREGVAEAVHLLDQVPSSFNRMFNLVQSTRVVVPQLADSFDPAVKCPRDVVKVVPSCGLIDADMADAAMWIVENNAEVQVDSRRFAACPHGLGGIRHSRRKSGAQKEMGGAGDGGGGDDDLLVDDPPSDGPDDAESAKADKTGTRTRRYKIYAKDSNNGLAAVIDVDDMRERKERKGRKSWAGKTPPENAHFVATLYTRHSVSVAGVHRVLVTADIPGQISPYVIVVAWKGADWQPSKRMALEQKEDPSDRSGDGQDQQGGGLDGAGEERGGELDESQGREEDLMKLFDINTGNIGNGLASSLLPAEVRWCRPSTMVELVEFYVSRGYKSISKCIADWRLFRENKGKVCDALDQPNSRAALKMAIVRYRQAHFIPAVATGASVSKRDLWAAEEILRLTQLIPDSVVTSNVMGGEGPPCVFVRTRQFKRECEMNLITSSPASLVGPLVADTSFEPSTSKLPGVYSTQLVYQNKLVVDKDTGKHPWVLGGVFLHQSKSTRAWRDMWRMIDDEVCPSGLQKDRERRKLFGVISDGDSAFRIALESSASMASRPHVACSRHLRSNLRCAMRKWKGLAGFAGWISTQLMGHEVHQDPTQPGSRPLHIGGLADCPHDRIQLEWDTRVKDDLRRRLLGAEAEEEQTPKEQLVSCLSCGQDDRDSCPCTEGRIDGVDVAEGLTFEDEVEAGLAWIERWFLPRLIKEFRLCDRQAITPPEDRNGPLKVFTSNPVEGHHRNIKQICQHRAPVHTRIRGIKSYLETQFQERLGCLMGLAGPTGKVVSPQARHLSIHLKDAVAMSGPDRLKFCQKLFPSLQTVPVAFFANDLKYRLVQLPIHEGAFFTAKEIDTTALAMKSSGRDHKEVKPGVFLVWESPAIPTVVTLDTETGAASCGDKRNGGCTLAKALQWSCQHIQLAINIASQSLADRATAWQTKQCARMAGSALSLKAKHGAGKKGPTEGPVTQPGRPLVDLNPEYVANRLHVTRYLQTAFPFALATESQLKDLLAYTEEKRAAYRRGRAARTLVAHVDARQFYVGTFAGLRDAHSKKDKDTQEPDWDSVDCQACKRPLSNGLKEHQADYPDMVQVVCAHWERNWRRKGGKKLTETPTEILARYPPEDLKSPELGKRWVEVERDLLKAGYVYNYMPTTASDLPRTPIQDTFKCTLRWCHLNWACMSGRFGSFFHEGLVEVQDGLSLTQLDLVQRVLGLRVAK